MNVVRNISTIYGYVKLPRPIQLTSMHKARVAYVLAHEWVKDYKLLELIKHKRVEMGTLMQTNEYTEYNNIVSARNLPTLTNIQYKRIMNSVKGDAIDD